MFAVIYAFKNCHKLNMCPFILKKKRVYTMYMSGFLHIWYVAVDLNHKGKCTTTSLINGQNRLFFSSNKFHPTCQYMRVG